jgi:hypothetical protein
MTRNNTGIRFHGIGFPSTTGGFIAFAVVLIVIVAVLCVPDFTTIGDAGALQMAFVGAPAHASPTLN